MFGYTEGDCYASQNIHVPAQASAGVSFNTNQEHLRSTWASEIKHTTTTGGVSLAEEIIRTILS